MYTVEGIIIISVHLDKIKGFILLVSTIRLNQAIKLETVTPQDLFIILLFLPELKTIQGHEKKSAKVCLEFSRHDTMTAYVIASHRTLFFSPHLTRLQVCKSPLGVIQRFYLVHANQFYYISP